MPPTEKQKKNLIPYKKGQSGNPKGRPKGSSKANILKELNKVLLETRRMQIGGKRQTLEIQRIIAMKMVEQALKGKAPIIKIIIEQFHGYPTAKHEIEGTIGFTMEEMLERAKRHEDAERSSGSKKRSTKRRPKK